MNRVLGSVAIELRFGAAGVRGSDIVGRLFPPRLGFGSRVSGCEVRSYKQRNDCCGGFRPHRGV